jgi:hypothetical protein
MQATRNRRPRGDWADGNLNPNPKGPRNDNSRKSLFGLESVAGHAAQANALARKVSMAALMPAIGRNEVLDIVRSMPRYISIGEARQFANTGREELGPVMIGAEAGFC